MPDTELHLVAAHFDLARLYREAPRARLPLRDLDLDYVLHMAVDGVFGSGTLRPYHVEIERGRAARVLAYSERPAAALRERADLEAPPELHAACDWTRFASKPMPDRFAPGTRLAFDVRICPVVRLRAGARDHREGAEVDAFLARSFAVGPDVPLEREPIYLEWLAGQLERRGARLEGGVIEGFRLSVQTRRTQDEVRRSQVTRRPEASASGTLVVEDAAAFALAIRQGIGRHRAFGFGMLRLRRT